MKTKAKTYNNAVDTLRLVSILAVVLIHTTTRELEYVNLNVAISPLTLFFNQAARFAVPLFFMVSGFVLELNYHLNNSHFVFIKKRVIKILIPFVFWSFVYYFFVYRNSSISFSDALFSGNASYQLYFIPSLFIFYLAFPLLHTAYKIISNKVVILSLFAIELIALYRDYNGMQLNFSYPVNVAILNYIFFIFGMVFSRKEKQINLFVKKWFVVFTLLAITLSIYVYFEGREKYFATHNYLSFYSQWRPSIVFYSLSITGAIYGIAKKISNRFIKTLSSLSFFVFFSHVLVIEAVWPIVGTYISGAVFYLLVTSLSFVLAYLFHKNDKLTRLTG